MEYKKYTRKVGNHDHQHVEDELKGSFTTPHYADTLCKFGKEIEMSWSTIFQYFSRDEYFQLVLNEGR